MVDVDWNKASGNDNDDDDANDNDDIDDGYNDNDDDDDYQWVAGKQWQWLKYETQMSKNHT